MKVGGGVTTEIAFGKVGVPISQFPKIAEAVRTVMEAFMADFPETEFIDGEGQGDQSGPPSTENDQV